MASRILVVDDETDLEPLMLRRFRGELRDGAFEFGFAHDGVEALNRIETNPTYDMVLCDINMPNMDGLTLLGHLTTEAPLLKTVMVSAYGDMANIRTAMNRGAFDFVTKPIEFDDLRMTINKTLREIGVLREAIERRESAERAKLNLSRYFAPNLVETLAEMDEPFGPPREENVAVLFADIVGFTEFAATQRPEDLFEFIRTFHGRMAREVFAVGGTLDKYIGDGLMATFGTPTPTSNDASSALKCAHAMVHAIEDLNTERNGHGGRSITIALGLHYGPALLGNIGDESRLEFAAIGETVNIASRLEELSRLLSANIVVSDDLVQTARDEANRQEDILSTLSARGAFAVRGLAKPVAVWTA